MRTTSSIILALLGLTWQNVGMSWAQQDIDPEPRIAFRLGFNNRFGLTVLKDPAGKPLNKRLTYSDDGNTNSTTVKIDGKELEFGGTAGKWVELKSAFPNGVRSVWVVGPIEFSQILQIVPSKQPVEVAPGVRKRLLDTCLIRYEIVNKDSQPHSVGIRLQVDTLIGSNDGVPFAVPTLTGLVNTQRDFPNAAAVPEFIQALEVPDLAKPGTVGLMTLKVGGDLEPPGKVSLTHWPGSVLMWNIPMINMGSDSAVILYWNPDPPLPPQQTRRLGFAYGLGAVSGSEGTGKLALTVNGSFETETPFTLTAYVQNPEKGQTLSLVLPAELARIDGKDTEVIPPPTDNTKGTSIVSWKITPHKAGQFTLKVNSSNGLSQSQPVSIKARSTPIPEPGKLVELEVTGTLLVEQILTAKALVKNPIAGQTVTLLLPEGLERVEGDESQALAKPESDSNSFATWKVKALKEGEFKLDAKTSGSSASKTIQIHRPPSEFTILDARKALQMSVGNLPENLIYDLDQDGRVTSNDAALILKRVADKARQGK